MKPRSWVEEMRGERDAASAPPSHSVGVQSEPGRASWRWRAGRKSISQRGSAIVEEWKSSVFSLFFFYFITPSNSGHESPEPEAAVGGVSGGGGELVRNQSHLGGVIWGTKEYVDTREEETGAD